MSLDCPLGDAEYLRLEVTSFDNNFRKFYAEEQQQQAEIFQVF